VTTHRFIVGLTDVNPNISNFSTPTLWNYTLCGQYPGFVPAEETVTLHCPDNLPLFSYVIVQLPTTGQLNLCELEVIALGTWLRCISVDFRSYIFTTVKTLI